MSHTSVRFKASSTRNEMRSPMEKDKGTAYDAKRQGSNATMKTASTLDDDKVEQEKNASPIADDTAKSKSSTFDGIIKKVRPYFDKHGHAVVYGIIGIVAAILILTIGFWPVFLLAVFAAIGIAIGKVRDSGISMQSAAKSLAENFRR